MYTDTLNSLYLKKKQRFLFQVALWGNPALAILLPTTLYNEKNTEMSVMLFHWLMHNKDARQCRFQVDYIPEVK